MANFAQRSVGRVLERLLPEDVAEAVIGDLLEEHTLRVRTAGPCRASLWYWGEVVRSVAPLLRMAFRRGDWVLAWVVGWAGYSLAASVEVAARRAVALVATHTAVDAIPVLVLYVGTIALAALLAERVKAGAALALALVVALTAAVELVTAAHGMPLWYRLGLVVLGPAAALASDKGVTRPSHGAGARRRRRTVA